MNEHEHQTRARYAALDGLRGVAALLVVVLHVFSANPDYDAVIKGGIVQRFLTSGSDPAAAAWNLVLRLVSSGSESVILFFVLSGFVLYLPFKQGRRPEALRFMARRMLRIYLPFLASILLALGAIHAFGAPGQPLGTPWLGDFWTSPPDAAVILRNLAMIVHSVGDDFNPVTWSLAHELRVSLLFPLLVWAVHRAGPGAALVASLLLTFAASAAMKLVPFDDAALSVVKTGYYQSCFFAGIAVHAMAAHRWWARLTAGRWGRAGVLGLGVTLFYAGALAEIRPIVLFLCVTAGSALLIAGIIASPTATRGLTSRPGRFLGRISYSLYLVHLPIIIVALGLVRDKAAFDLAGLYLIPISILAACVFHHLVERPSLTLSRAVAERAPPTPVDDYAGACRAGSSSRP